MGEGLKSSTTAKSTQNRDPPAWAKPLLTTAAQSALDLFNSGQGYNVYRGPTVANMSPEKLQALNKMMQMTGSTAAPITNEAMTGASNPQIAQIQQMIAQQQQAQQAARAQAAAAAAARAAPVAPQKTVPNNSYGTSVTRGYGSNR